MIPIPIVSLLSLTAPLLMPAGAQPAVPQDAGAWPEYRGPSQDGHVAAARPPLEWSEDENVAWKRPVHGRSWSSPVVLEGRVWLTTATEEGHALSVLAFDLASGEPLLDRIQFEVEEPQHRNALNSYASPSAVLEPGRAYVHFGDAGTACLDAESGETLWQRRDIRCDHMEGPGSSPILFEDSLIFNVDGGDVQFVIALDKATGATKWQSARAVDLSDLPADLRKAFSTPIVIEVGGRLELISTGSRATFAYDPRTGKELWSLKHDGFSMSSRPLLGTELLYVNTGFMRPRLYAVRPGGSGDVSATHVEWSTANGVPSMPSPLFHDGLLTMVSDGGIVTCLDGANGELLWKERVGGEFSASPVQAGERIYLFDREGKATVLRSGPAFEVLAESELDAGCMASPAIVGDALIVRTKTHLYRLQETAER